MKKITFQEFVKLNESVDVGDKLIHKHNPDISIELVEPTNKGWKVKQTGDGTPKGKKKTKTAHFDKQDIKGPKSLFVKESVNENKDGTKVVIIRCKYPTASRKYPKGAIIKDAEDLFKLFEKSPKINVLGHGHRPPDGVFDSFMNDPVKTKGIYIQTTVGSDDEVSLINKKLTNSPLGKHFKMDDKIIESVTEKKHKIKTIHERRKSKYDYEVYHNSFTSAADTARELAEKYGYEVDENSWWSEVATGKYGRSRPEIGKTHKFIVELTKDGKPQRKALHFQVYGMESGRYELNAYVQ